VSDKSGTRDDLEQLGCVQQEQEFTYETASTQMQIQNWIHIKLTYLLTHI